MTEPTRVAQDYVKAIWAADEWGDGRVTAKQLAERFGVTPATVSATLRRLGGQGLLRHAPYGAIELTEEGERQALAMVRRHRLLETFLVETLHYDWTEVHEEAEELEHVVSDRMVARIAELLGNPTRDPHGDPIPDPAGRLDRPAAVERLDRALPGSWRVARVADDDPAVLTRLSTQGVRPGSGLAVLDSDRTSSRVLPDGAEAPVVLDAATAATVLVAPA